MSDENQDRHEHSHNERLQKLRELSDEQLQALSDDEFWDAIEPEGVCPTCDPRLAEEARRRNVHAPWKH
jgi:hypothetical protein